MGSLLESIGGPVDSFSLNWKNKEEWGAVIKELNTTLEDAMEVIKKGNENIEVVRKIKDRKEEVMSDEREIVIDLEREDEEERSDRRKVTFYIENIKCTSALERVIRALENVSDIPVILYQGDTWMVSLGY